MKPTLVLLALLQSALCAQQVVDPIELQAALQSKHLDEWIQSIAAKRNTSKDAVRSNIQAVTYHLDPGPKHPGSAGGAHPHLERRQTPKEYPPVYLQELHNDLATKIRLLDYHMLCSHSFEQPAGSPYTPTENVPSFWRAVGGGCRTTKSVRVACKLPQAFGPLHWRQGDKKNVRETSFVCIGDTKCAPFNAHNFIGARAVQWGGCVSEITMDKQEVQNTIPSYFEEYGCPLSPGTRRDWALFGESTDEKHVDWTLFTGSQLKVSRSPTFLWEQIVEWKNKDPDYRPWLKFARVGQRATIRLYSHLV